MAGAGIGALYSGAYMVNATFRQERADRITHLRETLKNKDDNGKVYIPAVSVIAADYPYDSLKQADLADPLVLSVNRSLKNDNGLTYTVPTNEVVAFRMNASTFDARLKNAPQLSATEQNAAKFGRAFWHSFDIRSHKPIKKPGIYPAS